MARGRPRSTSLPYVPVDPHIDEHDKTQALIDALEGHTNIPRGYIVEIPQKIAKYCGRCRVDGVLGVLSAEAVARITEFDGPPGVLFDALVRIGWLGRDAKTGVLTFRNWCDYGGRVVKQRAKWRRDKEAEPEGAAGEPGGGELSARNSQRYPRIEGEGEEKKREETPGDIPRGIIADNSPPPLLGIDAVKQLLSQPPYSWPMLWPADAEHAVMALCPVDRGKVVEAADATVRGADRPGPRYFASCLATALRPRSRAPQRAPVNRAQQQADDWAELVRKINSGAERSA